MANIAQGEAECYISIEAKPSAILALRPSAECFIFPIACGRAMMYKEFP